MINLYTILAFILILVVPTILVLILKDRPKALRVCAICLMTIYFIILFIGTTFNISLKKGNLKIAADFSKNWFSMRFLLYSFKPVNITINIALLFPLGFIVYHFANKHKFLKTILFSLLLSLFIEFYQFMLPISRTTELTDLLFNTLGGTLSALYCKFLEKFGAFKSHKKSEP